MYQFNLSTCKRCQSEINKDRLEQIPVVCQACGFSGSKLDSELDHKNEIRFIKWSSILCASIVASVLFIGAWGSHSSEMLGIKLSQVFGKSSAESTLRISEICMELKKYDCVEQSYLQLSQQGRTEYLSQLGQFQVKRKKVDQAAQTFNLYFQNGGEDAESAYQFAKILGAKGDVANSSLYFEKAINSKPEILQITVVQNYIKMLMTHGKNSDALRWIQEVRKSSSTAQLFMETEMKSLTQAAL